MLNLIQRTGVVVTLGATLASLALAANADAATYYACVKKKGGGIRIVSRTTKCKRSERKISFNSNGVPGKNGVNGLNGRNGTNGKNGTNGANGANGAKGETGPTGPSDAWAIRENGEEHAIALPAGSYVVSGDVYFGSGGAMECTVWHGVPGVSASGRISFATAGAVQWSLPVASYFSIDKPEQAWLECKGGGPIEPVVTVLHVATLHA